MSPDDPKRPARVPRSGSDRPQTSTSRPSDIADDRPARPLPERHEVPVMPDIDGGRVQFDPAENREPAMPRRGATPPGTLPINTDEHPTSDAIGPQQHGLEPDETTSPSPETETLDQQAMDQADEAGSALLDHDKVLKQPKR